MLAAGNFPRRSTICDFRAFRLKELSDLFVPVVKVAREMGLVRPGPDWHRRYVGERTDADARPAQHAICRHGSVWPASLPWRPLLL
jgi:hypothetical protein